MSEQKDLLADAVTRLFRDAGDVAAAAERHGWQQALWAQLTELGLPLLLTPENAGGIGGDYEDAYVTLHAAGRYAIPLPLAETMLAARLAAQAGFELPAGPASIATQIDGNLDAGRFSGRLIQVPWGRDADMVVTVLDRQLVLLRRTDAESISMSVNLAGEPRDTLVFRNARAPSARIASAEVSALIDYAALLRVAQTIGALEASLHRSIEYATQRKQFGRAIGQFQAVQQQLALFGAETAAAASAGQAASRAASVLGSDASFSIASAKLRSNLAIGLATATAHQVHAAIGFTHEYGLRHHTQRLWSWRSEYGNDRYWSDRLGAAVAARGAEHFWADMTARDDRAGSGARP